MIAICKKYFRLGDFDEFIKGRWYEYKIEIHEETKTELYYVDDQPMLERTFKTNFDDLQQRREDKLKSIGI
jgi:hypothetical protein